LQPIKKPGKISIHHYLGDFQGVGTIRVIFPSLFINNALRIPGYQFNSVYNTQYINDLKYYQNFTMVSFQRATTDKHLGLIQHFKTNIRKITKTPLTLEIDDLLWGIPVWNYASEYYTKYKDSVQQIMREVDGITVSTEFLKKEYSAFNEKIVVIPNHLPKCLWGEPIPQHTLDKPGKVRIVWAGSDNHHANTNLTAKGIKGGDFGPELMDFIRKTCKDYDWHILGGCPAELSDLKNNGITYHGWRSIFEYPLFARSLAPDIVIAPLLDCDFNRAKSNLKMLEAVALGAAGVYSDVEPYKGAMMLAKDDLEMVGMIENLAAYKELRGKVFEHDLQLVKDVLYWEDGNMKNVQSYIGSYLSLFGRYLEV